MKLSHAFAAALIGFSILGAGIAGGIDEARKERACPEGAATCVPEPLRVSDIFNDRFRKEMLWQPVDQAGHFLITAAPIALSRVTLGTPLAGLAIIPVMAYREYRQWPSERWWDPPLDWAFLGLGAAAGLFGRFRRREPENKPAGPGQR